MLISFSGVEITVYADSATENITATEQSQQTQKGDLEKLIENANIPVICAIIGIALIIGNYKKRKNSYSNDEYDYNENSYYRFNDENDNK